MSKISLSPNASGSGIFTIASPATSINRTLTLPDEAGTVLTSASTANFPAGSVLQVARAAVETQINTTSNTDIEASTSFRVTITPQSASSKFLVIIAFHVVVAGEVMIAVVKPKRSTDGGSNFVNLTDLTTGNNEETFRNTSGGGEFSQTADLFLDEPSTTNAVTYSLFLKSTGSNNLRLNDSGNGSRLIVMEIAG